MQAVVSDYIESILDFDVVHIASKTVEPVVEERHACSMSDV